MDLLNSVMLTENNPKLVNRNTCHEGEASLEGLNEENSFGEALYKKVLTLEMQEKNFSISNPVGQDESFREGILQEPLSLPNVLTGKTLPEDLCPETKTQPWFEQGYRGKALTGSVYKTVKSEGYREAFSSAEMMGLEKTLAVLDENRGMPTPHNTKSPVVPDQADTMIEPEKQRDFIPEEIALSQYCAPLQKDILRQPLENPPGNNAPGNEESALSGEILSAVKMNIEDSLLSGGHREIRGKSGKKQKEGNMEISTVDKKAEETVFPDKGLLNKVNEKFIKKQIFLKNEHLSEKAPFQKGETGEKAERDFSSIFENLPETIHLRKTIVSAAGEHKSITLETSGERAISAGLAHMVSFLKNEKGERKGILQVEPPELGKVRIIINTSDDKVQVHLTVERPEAGDIIKGSEDILREAMKRQGLTLGDLSVDVGNDGRESNSGKERNTFSGHKIWNCENPQPEEDGPILARIDLEKGILHWIA